MKLHFVIPRVIKNITVLLLILLSILTLLFWLFFADFKEKAFINAKKDYELNIDKYINKFENKIILFDNKSIQEYIKDAKNTDFIKDVSVKEIKKFTMTSQYGILIGLKYQDTPITKADYLTLISSYKVMNCGDKDAMRSFAVGTGAIAVEMNGNQAK